MGLCVFSLPISLVMIGRIYTLSYYHHQIGSMNHYPLFRVRSWNNGMRCVSLFILIAPCVLVTSFPFVLFPSLSNDPIRPDTVSDTKGLFLHVVLLVCLQELSAGKYITNKIYEWKAYHELKFTRNYIGGFPFTSEWFIQKTTMDLEVPVADHSLTQMARSNFP